MGIALLALSGLFQGLSTLHRPTPVIRANRTTSRPLRPVWATRHTTSVSAMPIPGPRSASQAMTEKTQRTSQTLRVMRVTEADTHHKGAGRMVISGRMADVCAELDRLAALEATQTWN